MLDLERHQQEHALQSRGAPIDIVTEKEVAGVGWQPLELKEPEQVEELTVDVAHDLQRRLELQQHWRS